jgi:hypothetical protein
MKELRSELYLLQMKEGPRARLSSDEVLKTVEKLRVEFEIDDRPLVSYKENQ